MTLLPLQLTSISFSEGLIIAVLGFCIVLVVLAVLAVFVKILSSIIRSASGAAKEKPAEKPKKAVKPAAPVNAPAPIKAASEKAPAATASAAPGYITLDGVSEQEAAVIMAVTSHKTNTNLSHLQFSMIKRLNQNPELANVSEQDAAVLMALTSHKTGIPLENLIFNSIKLLEE